MKLILVAITILLAATRLEAKLIKFLPGNLYVYNYHGHHLSSVDNVGNRQVGAAYAGKVLIYAKEYGEYILQLKSWHIGSINEDVKPPVDENELEFNFEPLSGPQAKKLEYPVLVLSKDGDIQKFRVSQNMPEEFINIIKAILTLIQIDVSRCLKENPDVSNGFSKRTNTLVTPDKDVFVKRFMEDGISGDCETSCSVRKEPSPYQPDADVLNVTKVVNLNKCESRPLWVRSSIIPDRCADCDADKLHPFPTVSRVDYGIRINESEVIMETIINEAYTLVKPFTGKADFLRINHTQIMTLENVEPIVSPIPEVESPQIRHSLQYEFPTAVRAKPTSMKTPLTPFLNDDHFDVLPEAVEFFDKLINSIIDETVLSKFNENVTIYMYIAIVGIRRMKYDTVADYFNKVTNVESSLDIEKSDRIDVVTQLLAMSGSPAAFMYLKFLIESEVITGETAIQAIQAIPTNAYEPTYQLISEILSLARHDVVMTKPELKITTWLAVGILISKACNVRTVPRPPYIDDFCPESVQRKLLNDINEQLRAAKKLQEVLLFVKVLGSTQLKGAIKFLIPYASGKAFPSETVQIIALMTLKEIAATAPEEVLEVAESQFFDTKNPRTVRIAALQTILDTDTTFSILQRIVLFLNREPSDDLAGYIVSYFDNIGNASHYCLNDKANHARQLMAFIDKELDNGIQGSNYRQWSQTFDEFGISTQSEAKWIASNSSIVPETFYFQSNVTVGGYSYQPVEFVYHTKGLQSVINNLAGPTANFKPFPTLKDIFKPESQEPHLDRSEINGKLELDTREEDPFVLALFLKLGGTQAQALYFDHKMIVEAIKSGLVSKSKFHKILHCHKLSLFYEVETQIPSTIGVPILVHLFNPQIISVKGHVSAELVFGPGHGHTPLPGAVKIRLQLKPSYTSQKVLRLEAYNPFTRHVDVAAVQTVDYVTLPVTASVDADIVEGKIHFNFKPFVGRPMPNTETVLYAKFRVEPYSCHYSTNTTTDFCFHRTVIHNDPEPTEGVIDIGKTLLGVPLAIQYVTEADWPDMAAFRSYLDEFEDVFSFITTLFKISEFAPRKYKLVGDQSKVFTQEINATLSWLYTPTPIEKRVLESKETAIGFWTVLSGFARLPQRCHSEIAVQDFSAFVHHRSKAKGDFVPFTGGIKPSQVETIRREEEVSKLRLMLVLSARARQVTQARTILTLRRDLDRLTDNFTLTTDIGNPHLLGSRGRFCSSGSIRYPEAPCDFPRLISPVFAPKSIDLELKAAWGVDRCKTEPNILIEGKLLKSDEQEEIVLERDGWYFSQCQEDLRKGMKLSKACQLQIAEQHSFKKINVTVTYDKLPGWVKNVTYFVDTFLKVRNYVHMSNNPVIESEDVNRLRVIGSIYQDVDAFDLQLYKPTENTFFTKVPFDFPYLYPLSTRTTVGEQFLDEITDGMAFPTCQVMGNYINTFDNDTLRTPPIDCHRVIAKDCSPHDLFAVTLAETRGKKVIRVYVLGHIAEIKQQDAGPIRFHIDFDRKILKPTNDDVVIVKTGDESAPNRVVAVFVTTDPILYVQLPLTGVIIKFDGTDVEVSVSQLWRGRVCGLCSEFRGDTMDDLVGPDQCLYPDPDSFGTGYALPDYGCKVPKPPNDNKICGDEYYDKESTRLPPVIGGDSLESSLPLRPASPWAGRPAAFDPCPCPKINDPVCGSDGVTYANRCELECVISQGKDVEFKCNGECPCRPCPLIWAPICGTDGETYYNKCDFDSRRSPNVTKECEYPCPCPRTGVQSVELPKPQVMYWPPPAAGFPCVCPAIYQPVCGSNNKTYGNRCELECAIVNGEDVEFKCNGECPCRPCPYIWDPICGTDGETYYNKCDFDSRRPPNVTKECGDPCPCPRTDGPSPSPGNFHGKPQVSPPIICSCPDILRPVCGTDGKTYANQCELECAKESGVEVEFECNGACPCARCTLEWNPKCGTDGNTYGNQCFFNSTAMPNVTILCDAPCPCNRVGDLDLNLERPIIPCKCPRIIRPVCGTNGLTYSNQCLLECAIINSVDVEFECNGPCPCKPCTREWLPRCGDDGKTYGNPCEFETHAPPNVTKVCDAPCPCLTFKRIAFNNKPQLTNQEYWDYWRDWAPRPQQPQSACTKKCTKEYIPVCGTDGKTYGNRCLLDCAREDTGTDIEFECNGPCPCKVCPYIYDPVCGSDGETYPSQCDFNNTAPPNVTVMCKKECPCPIKSVALNNEPQLPNRRDWDFWRNWPPRPQLPQSDCTKKCTKEYIPVCGTGGVTYGNRCLLDCAIEENPDIEFKCNGPCPCKVCPSIWAPVCGSDGETYPNQCEFDNNAPPNVTKECDAPCPCPIKRKKFAAAGSGDLGLTPPKDSRCFCTEDDKPVCGNNSKTYTNRCHLDCDMASGEDVMFACNGPCPCKDCPDVYEPVCGSDDVIYLNQCVFDSFKPDDVTKACDGKCPCPIKRVAFNKEPQLPKPGRYNLNDWFPRPQEPQLACSVKCSDEYLPVCGSNGKTYGNLCLLKCAQQDGVDVKFLCNGACPCEFCPMVWDPICGSDNVTYGNQCVFDTTKPPNVTEMCEKECPCPIKRSTTVTPTQDPPGPGEPCGDVRVSVCMEWCAASVRNETAECQDPYMCCVLV